MVPIRISAAPSKSRGEEEAERRMFGIFVRLIFWLDHQHIRNRKFSFLNWIFGEFRFEFLAVFRGKRFILGSDTANLLWSCTLHSLKLQIEEGLKDSYRQRVLPRPSEKEWLTKQYLPGHQGSTKTAQPIEGSIKGIPDASPKIKIGSWQSILLQFKFYSH